MQGEEHADFQIKGSDSLSLAGNHVSLREGGELFVERP